MSTASAAGFVDLLCSVTHLRICENYLVHVKPNRKFLIVFCGLCNILYNILHDTCVINIFLHFLALDCDFLALVNCVTSCNSEEICMQIDMQHFYFIHPLYVQISLFSCLQVDVPDGWRSGRMGSNHIHSTWVR